MEKRDYLEITFRSINCFADDGKLDVNELNSLVEIALKDNVVDENEKRVLRNVIARLSNTELTDEMRSKLDELRDLYDI
jgi:predicted ATP-dependent Lon-type protease